MFWYSDPPARRNPAKHLRLYPVEGQDLTFEVEDHDRYCATIRLEEGGTMWRRLHGDLSLVQLGAIRREGAARILSGRSKMVRRRPATAERE